MSAYRPCSSSSSETVAPFLPLILFMLIKLISGTVISIHPTPSLAFAAPIAFRLKSRDTVLRKSADPSLLLHALLDLGEFLCSSSSSSPTYHYVKVVDKAVQVIDQYHAKIHKFERDILLRPKMDTVRQREASASFPVLAAYR